MPRLAAIIAMLSVLSSALAQEHAKPENSGKQDFVYTTQKTLDGKDFGYFVSASRWASEQSGATTVYVCWENYDPAMQREHKLVQDAVANTWQKYAKLDFRGWEQCAAKSSGIRIFVHDDAEDGPHTKGLGSDLDGEDHGMVLNFTFKDWSASCRTPLEKRDFCIRSIAVHEFGHAIGFAHEQNRPDKPGECLQPAQGEDAGAEMLTPYDPGSVMNYCNERYNNNGELSELDIVALRKMYGAK
jgi:hypothetical protein